MNEAAGSSARIRLEQIDGLRAVAALSVVGFHFTTRYDEVFVHASPIQAGFDLGYLGVNLFFVISGFVIFMTIEAAGSPRDFAFSRFSRLFPTYWAAVILTWLLTLSLPIPGNVRSAGQMLANLTMVHEQFGVPSVDGVYWSLEVELIYYLWMLALASSGWLRRPQPVVLCWLALAAAAALAVKAGLTVPHALLHHGLLRWIPWFGLGMIAYLVYRGRASLPFAVAGLVLALAAIRLQTGWREVALACCAWLGIWMASRHRLRPAGWKPLVFIGAISYPLYLVHEQVGWLLMLNLQERGVAPWATIGVAVLACVAVAWLLHVLVEMPSMARMRRWWRTRSQPKKEVEPFHPRAAAVSMAVLLVLVLGPQVVARLPSPPPEPLASTNDWPADAQQACPDSTQGERRILVILGQSNAASHAAAAAPSKAIPVLHDGRCARVADPLPGTTGTGASLWTEVLPSLNALHPGVVDVAAPFAVGATTIREWVRPGRLRALLEEHLAASRAQGSGVDLVLWQQGEADMLRGTEARDYLRDLRALRSLLDASGVRAPLVVARSTRCFAAGLGAGSIRRVLQRHEAALRQERIVIGPDTDSIGAEGRSDGCHFNDRGRRAAAALWVRALAQVPRMGSASPIGVGER